MFSYIIRRLLYAIPILAGVMLITFWLFFKVEPPLARARSILGEKARPKQIADWLHNHGYDKPTFVNTEPGHHFYDSLFVSQMERLITFDFGVSDKTSLPIAKTFAEGIVPSLCLTLPAFVIGFIMAVSLSLYQVFVRYSALDKFGVFLCVALMSLPPMIYMFIGQSFLALQLNYFPAYGFDLRGWETWKFLLLPISLMVVMYLGYDIRLYRSIFLEEITQDYVRTASAKGVSQTRLLFVHVLKNGTISLITLVVAHLPFLIMGSLLVENFFGIPGLGNSLVHAVQTGDAAMVNALVYLGALFYIAGLLLTDICYALADPRIRCRDPMTEMFQHFFAYWLTQDSIVVAGFALLFFLLRSGSRNERWQRAWKFLKRDRLGLVAGVVIFGYLLVGTLDLFKLGPSFSVFDWMMRDVAGLRDEPTKASYSAPFADRTFSLAKPIPLVLPGRHILGTTQIGKDTLVQAMKGSSTALLLGGITSVIYLPLSILLGISAGYYRGWVDDAVQYIYSTIMAIPEILFLIAFIMVFQKGIGTMCWALALTSWIGLCRLLRGETMRLTERQFVSAARALGQSHWNIITRHLLPNTMHLVLINFVLGFSNVVLTEAILSYLGVGTPIGTASWGQMIDGARGELSRQPLVWWNVAAAGFALFGLVLSLNLFADSLRRAFDSKRS